MAKKNTSVIQVMITGDARDLERATSTAGTALYAMAKVASFATSVVGGIATASVKAASDFESAFAGVEKTVKATDAQLAQLSDGIREMSTRMPASAVEIAGVAEAAGQLGIQTDAILGFSEVMIMLGDTTNIAATDAASVLARLASITQMPQDEFDRLGASVVALGNSLPTTEAEIVEMSLGFAGMANVLGLTEAQILAFSGAVSSVGIEAEAGGSSLTRIFSTINTAVSESGGQLQTFARIAGMSASDFSQAFRTDAAGAVNDLIRGFQNIGYAGEDVTRVLQEVELDEIRVQRTMLGLIGAGDRLSGSLTTASEAWQENTALTEEARKRYETFASQLSILKNNFTDVAIEIGLVLLPYLVQFIGWFKEAMPAIRDFVNDALPMIDEFATSISTFIREKAIPAIQNFFDGVDKSAMIAGLRETFMSAIAAAVPVVADLVAITKTLGEDLGLAIQNSDPKAFGEAIGNFVSDAFREGVDFAIILGNWVDEQVSKRGGYLAIGTRLAIVGTELLFGFFIGLFSDENMAQLTTLIGENIGDVFKAALILGMLPKRLVGAITLGLSKLFPVGTIAAGAVKMLAGLGGKLLTPITSAFSGMKNGFLVGASKLADEMPMIFGRLTNRIPQLIDEAVPKATSAWRRWFEGIGISIGEGFTRLTLFFKTKFDDLGAWFALRIEAFVKVGKDFVLGLIRGIGDQAGALISRLRSLADDALKAIKSRLGISSPSVEMMLVGADMMRGMALGIAQSAGLVDKQLGRVVGPMLSMDLSAPSIGSRASGGGSTVNLTVNGAIDPEGTARTIIRVLEDAQRRSGVRLAV